MAWHGRAWHDLGDGGAWIQICVCVRALRVWEFVVFFIFFLYFETLIMIDGYENTILRLLMILVLFSSSSFIDVTDWLATLVGSGVLFVGGLVLITYLRSFYRARGGRDEWIREASKQAHTFCYLMGLFPSFLNQMRNEEI